MKIYSLIIFLCFFTCLKTTKDSIIDKLIDSSYMAQNGFVNVSSFGVDQRTYFSESGYVNFKTGYRFSLSPCYMWDLGRKIGQGFIHRVMYVPEFKTVHKAYFFLQMGVNFKF